MNRDDVSWVARWLNIARHAVQTKRRKGIRVEADSSVDLEDACLTDRAVTNHDQIYLFLHLQHLLLLLL